MLERGNQTLLHPRLPACPEGSNGNADITIPGGGAAAETRTITYILRCAQDSPTIPCIASQPLFTP